MQQNQSINEEVDPETMKKKLLAAKILVCAFALACVILVIFILSKSSIFFGYLFSLSTQEVVKMYLKTYYKNYMVALYFSIFGFVICCSNTILFFFKFTQKDKIVWFHAIYFISIFICGIVALTNTQYDDYMKRLSQANLSAAACALLPLPQQCALSRAYISYRGDFVAFYVCFIIFFILYSVVYHYSVLKLLPFQQQQQIKQNQLKKQAQIRNNSSIMDVKKNETFVSEMLDDYIYQ